MTHWNPVRRVAAQSRSLLRYAAPLATTTNSATDKSVVHDIGMEIRAMTKEFVKFQLRMQLGYRDANVFFQSVIPFQNEKKIVLWTIEWEAELAT